MLSADLGRFFDQIAPREAVPICAESPFVGGERFTDWWTLMRDFDAHGLVYAIGMFSAPAIVLGPQPPELWQMRLDLRAAAERLADKCDELGFAARARDSRRFLGFMDRAERGEIDNDQIVVLAQNLTQGLVEDLAARGVFQLTAAEVPYYNGEFFERPLHEAFPDAATDMDEAGRCFALNRDTATVFHLMRVVEVGLKDFAASARVQSPTQSSWGAWLKACRDANANPDVVARLHTIKDGWRNPSMHVERAYDHNEAEELMIATRSFMRGVSGLIGK